MNYKKTLVLIILLSCMILNVFGEKRNPDNNKVIVFAFDNQGGLELEMYREMVPNSFYALLKDISQYTAVPWEVLKSYLEENNFQAGDLQNPDTLISIAKEFDATSIIRGYYTEKSDFFVITFEVIDVISKKVIYRSEKFGDGGIFVPDTLDNVIAELVQDFTGLKIEFAYIDMRTDKPCTLYLDNNNIGSTPIRTRVLTGKHEIRVAFEDEENGIIGDVYKGEINLKKDEEQSYNIRVLVDIEITAELPCEISINTERVGTTPYTGQLLSGNEYEIKAEYFNSEKQQNELVDQRVISTKDEKDIKYDLMVTGTIQMLSGNIPFKGGLSEVPSTLLPRMFDSMPLGQYRAQCFLDDPKTGDIFIFYDKLFYLSPLEEKIIDLGDMDFQKSWEYLFVPSLPQFHNKQPVKASIVLSGFAFSLATGIVCSVLASSIYNNDYLPLTAEYNKAPLTNAALRGDIDSYYNNVLALGGLAIGGFVMAGGIYLYSVIDGGITMDRIYELFYGEN